MLEIQELFTKEFGVPPQSVVQAPGRLELLGNHTDYNEGLVMALAIDKFIFMAAAPRTDGRIELVSSAFPGRESFRSAEINPNPQAPWANYVKGVLVQLRERGVPFGGFNAAIHGTIPIGAGLSSSAALEVATALTVRNLFPYRVTEAGIQVSPALEGHGTLPPLLSEEKLALAKICQAAENQFVGVHCGLLDQISSLFGKAQHVVQIDCRDLTVQQTPMVGEVAVVVCNSGVNHALVGGEYNELRRQCETSAQALGVPSLRLVDPPMLDASQARLSPRQYQCAYHVVGENQRVRWGENALRRGDFRLFGQYLYQSHESSRDYFHNSCAALDQLVDLARQAPGCLGARLTGGGFGGATINLVSWSQVQEFSKYMAKAYRLPNGKPLEPMLCQVVDGAQ
jgi:galactokinase